MDFIDYLTELTNGKLIYPFTALVFILFIILEICSGLKNPFIKKILIILISSGLMIWMDIFSWLLLLALSGMIFVGIKNQLAIGKHFTITTIIMIFLLIVIKDYKYFVKIENPYIPLGISYYFFRLISFFVDYSKRPREFSEIKLIDYYTYVFFFPIFLAGPIQRFIDFKNEESTNLPENRVKYYTIITGAIAIKMLLVDSILYKLVYLSGIKYLNVFIDNNEIDYFAFKVSLFGLLAFLHAYLDLMLYTEISKSFSRILGYTVQENFNRPLLASNISQFWQRWHMSLSNWTRDYIFFPTLVKTKKVWFSTYMSMLTIGIWHAFQPNWIIWALSHGTAINIYGQIRTHNWYKTLDDTTAGKFFLRITGNVVTIYFISFIFILVAQKDINQAFQYYIYFIKDLLL